MDEKQRQTAASIVFVLFAGLPAMSLTGFLFDFGLTLPVAIVIATIGGAVGGVLLCPRPWLAGLVGGILAGPIGLVAVYYYTQHRHSLWNIELVIVQMIGSLPGFLIGKFLKNILPGGAPLAPKVDAPSDK